MILELLESSNMQGSHQSNPVPSRGHADLARFWAQIPGFFWIGFSGIRAQKLVRSGRPLVGPGLLWLGNCMFEDSSSFNITRRDRPWPRGAVISSLRTILMVRKRLEMSGRKNTGMIYF